MVGNQMSSGFLIASRVHEGYVIAPDSFATSMDWLLERSVGRGMSGITFGQCTFTDLDFADEISLLAELLGRSCCRDIPGATPLGLEVNWQKNNGSSTGLLSRTSLHVYTSVGTMSNVWNHLST